jgi:CoA transferase family III
MSCGIAAAQGGGDPRPLPAQVLDHATAMHLAAAICRALTIRTETGVASDIRASLIGAANLVWQLPDPAARPLPDPGLGITDTERRMTAWGPARAVPIPGRIGHERPRLDIDPGPLGRDEPAFGDGQAKHSSRVSPGTIDPPSGGAANRCLNVKAAGVGP